MSMNIFISACRDVFTKFGKHSTQSSVFQAWQTPTAVTQAIINSPDPIQAYKDWVLERGKEFEREELAYADDDIFCERDPIGTQIYIFGLK